MNFRQIRGWQPRLCGLFNRKRREREFAEELDSDLALHIEDNLPAGMSPEEAQRQALIKLGGVALTQERYREQRGLRVKLTRCNACTAPKLIETSRNSIAGGCL